VSLNGYEEFVIVRRMIRIFIHNHNHSVEARGLGRNGVFEGGSVEEPIETNEVLRNCEYGKGAVY